MANARFRIYVLLVSQFILVTLSGVKEPTGILSHLDLDTDLNNLADYLRNGFVTNGAACVSGAAKMTVIQNI